MKIAVDCRMSGKSGIGTFFDEILPFLKESGHQLFLFGTEENPCSVKTFSIKEIVSFPKELLREINKCDAYFTPYCNIPGGIKIPVFSTIHDVVFLDVQLSGKIGTFARKLFYKRAARKSAAVFTVSDFSKNRIIHHLNCKKPIEVVYNGIPKYLEVPINPKPQKKNQVIFIGNIKKHKGLATLVQAFPKFHEETGAKLLIVGSQDNFRTQDEEAAKIIDEANKITNNSIEFTGFVEDEKLKILLAESRLLVQPSLYEGFGIPPLQALCVGTNAVISDIEVFKEIYREYPVRHFETGNSIDLAQKMLEEWNHPHDLTNIPQIFTYKKTAEKILLCFEKFCKQ